jgi:hypothetical protein
MIFNTLQAPLRDPGPLPGPRKLPMVLMGLPLGLLMDPYRGSSWRPSVGLSITSPADKLQSVETVFHLFLWADK